MASTKINVTLKKIDSPFAKYNSVGQLMCIVCNVVIKSEMVWTAHANGRQHHEQLFSIKKAKIAPSAVQPKDYHAVKRKPELEASTETAPSPIKKGIPNDFFDKKPIPVQNKGLKEVKGILKNSSKPQNIPKYDAMEVDEAPALVHGANLDEKGLNTEKEEAPNDLAEAIPEGFFDDPKLDAKVRHKEYKDPVEEEWNRFQKEINEEVTTSASMQEEDQEEATLERQLEEIEEQMLKWSRVLELEKRKDVCAQNLQALREAADAQQYESSSDEDDVESDVNDIFNWRSKGT